MDTAAEQESVCRRYRAPHVPAPADQMVGVAKNLQNGLQLVNGLRHPPTSGATGWYIWAGEELSDADDFFEPLHVAHLGELRPDILRFLGLPPGWRFLVAGDYEDVWFDLTLLNVS